jgi:hypothetical protein
MIVKKITLRLLLLGGGLFLGGAALPITGYSQENIRVLVDRLTVGGYEIADTTLAVPDTTTPIEQKFRRIGKSAIPYLIEAIDKDQKGFVGFLAQTESNVTLNASNYTGISAAYMIEYLLSNSRRFEIMDKGVIIPVVKLYQTWWEARKGESMKALQRDWKAGKRALAGAPNYKWL